MYKWTLKYRDTNGSNILNPEEFKNGYNLDFNGLEVANPLYGVTKLISVVPTQVYQVHSEDSNYLQAYSFFNYNKEYVSGVTEVNASTFTVPSGVYYVKASVLLANNYELMGITQGAGSAFEPYFTSREVQPVYKKIQRGYQLESSYQFYREKLDGNLKFLREDYDFIDALPFDTKIKLVKEDTEGRLQPYKAQFYKTDCKWDADNRAVEVKTDPDDYYVDVLAGLEKTFNIIQAAPELQEVTMRRRPVIQVYIPGDTVVTNLLGGTYWEQEIQIDPEFDHSALTNTYKFFNAKNIRIIPTSYAPSLSTDVTGLYDDSRLSPGGTYELKEEIDTGFYPGYNRRRYFIVPAGTPADFDGSWNSTALYKTGYTNWRESGVNLLEFTGTNGETGSFYFTEYRIYVRYYTDLLNVRGTNTYPVPNEDIVANNSNYKRVIGYNIPDSFYIYDEFVTAPTKFGKVPDGAPDAGKYYKEFLVSVATGLSNPLPVSSSNWRAVSLWFFNDLDIRYTEFIDGQDFELRDSYKLDSVIRVLLGKIGSTVSFEADTNHSEFLYATVNPLGGVTFLDFDGGTLLSDYKGNVDHFITPKSNVLTSNYDQPAQKSDITLGQVINMLRDIYKCHWHIDSNGRLRIEHITWYQNGGTYTGTQIGADLTTLVQPRNGKNWGFAQNKWEFDKESMPERFEYGWMDDVSPPFDGFPIQIISNYVQKGRIEDLRVNGITTDVDFVMANPQEVSKDGFVLMAAVNFQETTYENPVSSEYDGNLNLSAEKVGLRYQAVTDIKVKEITGKLYALPGKAVTASIMRGGAGDPDTASLVQSWSYAADEFNLNTNLEVTLVLNTEITLTAGEWIFMTLDTDDATTGVGIRCWNGNAPGTRDRFVYKFTSSSEWLVSSGVTYYSIPLRLKDKVTYRVPFIEADLGYNQEVILQNGLLSWLYLHPRFHVYDLPSDRANINNVDTTLYQNNTRKKKQEVTYPIPQGTTLDPYKLVKTQLGNGIVDKLSINIDSYTVKATIKHDTE